MIERRRCFRVGFLLIVVSGATVSAVPVAGARASTVLVATARAPALQLAVSPVKTNSVEQPSSSVDGQRSRCSSRGGRIGVGRRRAVVGERLPSPKSHS